MMVAVLRANLEVMSISNTSLSNRQCRVVDSSAPSVPLNNAITVPCLRAGMEVRDGDQLRSIQRKRAPVHTVRERQRQHTHANQVQAVDTLEALRDHGANAQEPSRPGTISF